jgi:hypothetical protein
VNEASAIEPTVPRVEALIPLDLVQLADHPYLSIADRCSFMFEFVSGCDVQLGDSQWLIRDFKCSPSAAAVSFRRAASKQRAIVIMAESLRAAVSGRAAQVATWVPIPPSKMPADAEFDDRLMRTLALAFGDYDVDLRQLLYQAQSTPADHLGSTRLTADALLGNLCLDLASLKERPVRQTINLFDDVLTTGKHYKCCERRLRDALPDTPISGVFLLRRALSRRWRGQL